MRRSRQQLSDTEAKSILLNATHGVLSLSGADGKPYGVPMSYIFDGMKSIYFHCAKEGRKLEYIRHSPLACFTVVEQDEIHPEEFTTYFRSAIAEGKLSVIEDRESMTNILKELSGKYSPGIDCEAEIEKGIGRVLILRFDIDSLTGKEAIELTKAQH